MSEQATNQPEDQEGCVILFRRTLFETILIFLLVAFAWFLYKQNTGKVILISDATMPEVLVKNGFTGEVFSRNLIEKIGLMRENFAELDVKLLPDKVESWPSVNNIDLSDFAHQPAWHTQSDLKISTQFFSITNSTNMFRLNRNTFAAVESEILLLQNGLITITFRITKSPLDGFIPALRLGPMNADDIDEDTFLKGALYTLKYIDPFTTSRYYLSKGQFEEAEKASAMIVGSLPEKFQAHAFHAETLEKNEKYAKAAKAFQKAYNLNTRSSHCLVRANLNYNRAIASGSLEPGEEAKVKKAFLAFATEYMESHQKSSYAHNVYGVALEKNEKFQGALEAYLKAMQTNKDDVYPVENAAQLFIRLNRAETGLIWLQEYTHFDQSEHSFWCSKARLEAASGMDSEARISAEIALGIPSEKGCCTTLFGIISG